MQEKIGALLDVNLTKLLGLYCTKIDMDYAMLV